MAITLDGTNGVTTPDLTVDTDTLTVDTTNNRVGIGTALPSQPLHVVGGAVRFENTQDTYFQINTADTHLYTAGSHPLRFGTNSAERMRIDSSGNVGIGTASPAAPLDTVSNTNGVAYRIRARVADEFGLLEFVNNAGTIGNAYIGTPLANSLAFYTNGLTERMRINSIGWVGIGDSTPEAAMDVVGNIHYTGTISDVSDRRLKENVLDLSDSLNKVCQLNAKSYTLIADRDNEEEEVELGFIAQEVQTVFPEVVKNIQKYVVDENGENTEKEINYLGVSYIQLIAPMVEAIKELKTEVDILKAKVTALEAANGS